MHRVAPHLWLIPNKDVSVPSSPLQWSRWDLTIPYFNYSYKNTNNSYWLSIGLHPKWIQVITDMFFSCDAFVITKYDFYLGPFRRWRAYWCAPPKLYSCARPLAWWKSVRFWWIYVHSLRLCGLAFCSYYLTVDMSKSEQILILDPSTDLKFKGTITLSLLLVWAVFGSGLAG